ncbi:chromosomal replication initiator protein DnaA [Candidatus Woesebacteria bacterium]|nr:MAG: chromosomal replication initiator protein DnaA [Candidatus Woesebacteria bacterium]
MDHDVNSTSDQEVETNDDLSKPSNNSSVHTEDDTVINSPGNKLKIWHEILESIKVSVSGAIFSTWFTQTHLSELKNVGSRYLAEVGCSSSFVRTTLEGRYFGLIQDALNKTLDKECDVLFIVKQQSASQDFSSVPLFQEPEKNEEGILFLISKSNLRKNFTFDNYAVSSTNQMAWAAADAVSKNLGNAYNPLFIWGGVGVGKTHLMHAVGHCALIKNSSSKILSCTGEDFTNDIVEGIRHKNTKNVRNKYRKLDALLVDDIQFIAGKDTVQEEFFHTFNSIVSVGGQIIITSDRPPSEISKLEERLRSRFEAGLIVDIGNPDFELRCAIVQIKAADRGINIPMDLIQLIAGNIDSAREIEGFLTKLSSEVILNKNEISKNLIETILSKKGVLNGDTQIKAQPQEVVAAVSKYYTLGKRSLLGASRARPVARPRQILMYLLRMELALPLEEVGRLVGGRDHTTVIHAVDKITKLASLDVQTRQDIRGIKNIL